MKNLKTKITIVIALFMLSTISISAQFTLPKTTTIKDIELKKGQYKDLKMLPSVNYDGYISQTLDGRYIIHWLKDGGVACCFNTIKEALNSNKKLIVATGGNQGFVYQETANGGVGKKISDAHIAFRRQNSTVAHYAHTNKYGRYKMGLLPGKYIVSIKHKGYKSYTTAPGFTVINKKFATFIIPLKKISKYPIKTNNIIASFNRKTGKLIDVVVLNKKNKQLLGRRKDAILFYGKSNRKIGLKNISKGTTIEVDLEKQFVPGDQFVLGDQFVPGDQFIPGDEFIMSNTKFKVISKTKKLLKIVAL